MTSGDLLLQIIKQKGIAQQDLADQSGVSQSSISRMMKGEQDLNYKLLMLLREKYKLDINAFVDADLKQNT